MTLSNLVSAFPMFPAVVARYESCITLCVQLELSPHGHSFNRAGGRAHVSARGCTRQNRFILDRQARFDASGHTREP